MGFLGSLLGTNSQFKATNDSADTNLAGAKTSSALTGQTDFANALRAQGGVDNQQSAFNQLQAVANGQGPNPAQAQLAQATGNNVANQAALMAGQRGAGSNVGLMARQAAMQGANTQQNAIGQAATLQANQSLGALNQLGGIANNQVNQQQNALNSHAQTALNNQQLVYGQLNQNNSINAGVQDQNAKNNGQLIGGILGAAGKGAAAMAHGGMAGVDETPLTHSSYFSGGAVDGRQGIAKVPGTPKVAGDSPKNDVVQAVLSPGEIVIPVSHAMDPNKAAEFARAVALRNSSRKGNK